MRPKGIFFVALGLAVLLALPGDAWAQLFGERTLGRVVGPRDRPSSADRRSGASRQSVASRPASGSSANPTPGVGMPDPTARYMRGNREATDFVGSDSREIQGFVGMQQAENVGEIRSAIDNLRVQTGPDANRTQPALSRPRAGMYAPRLKVGFNYAGPPAPDVNVELTRRLESALVLAETGSVEVSVEGATAILRGEVDSERERRLARLLLLLEPGISNVQNDLIVRSGPRIAPSPPARPIEGQP